MRVRNVSFIHRLAAGFAGLALAAGLAVPAAAETFTFPLVTDGRPAASVVYVGGNPDLDAAVADLARYVKRITGADLVLREQPADVPGPTLHLGETAHYNQTAAVRAAVAGDGFALVSVGEDLVVAGNCPQGTANGIMTLLQDHFGVRWYWAGGHWEIVPETASLAVTFTHDGNTRGAEVNPSFLARRYWGDNRTMARRMRTTLPGAPYTFQGTSHSIGEAVPDDLFAEHPDYFALWNGKRTTDGLCYTHPEMYDLLMAYVRNGGRAFGLKDNGVVCQCDRCNAVHEGSRQYNGFYNVSDSYFPLLQRVAEQAAREFPGARIGTFAYQTTNLPPRGVDFLADNLDITLCIDTSQQFDADYKALDREIVETWPKIAGVNSFYDYLGLSYWTPRYLPGLMADQMRHAAASGVTGYFSHTGTMPSSSMPMYYAYSRLMWDADFDIRAGIAEMMRDLYAEAAGPMAAFYDHWEECWMRPRTGESVDLPWRVGENNARWLYGIDDFFGEMRIYTEADFEKGEALLQEAKSLAQDKAVQARVHDIWFEYRFSYLAAKTYYEAQRALYTDPATPHDAYVQSASVTQAFRNFTFYYSFIKERPNNSATDWPGKTFFVRCWGLRAMLRDAVLAPFVRWAAAHEGEVEPYDLRRFEQAAAFQAAWNRTDIEAQMAEKVGAQERRPRADGLRVADIPRVSARRVNWDSIPEFDTAPWLYEERPENPKRGNYDDPHKYFYIDPPDPADHQVRGQAAWSDTHLLLRLTVTDDDHRQGHSGEALKRGDAVRVLLVPDRTNYKYDEHSWLYIWGGYHGTELDFTVGLAPNGVRVHVAETPEGLEKDAAREQIDADVTRRGPTTRYTLAIPWSLLPAFTPGPETSLGITLNVSDDDGGTLKVAEYGSGLTYGKRPSDCAALRLVR